MQNANQPPDKLSSSDAEVSAGNLPTKEKSHQPETPESGSIGDKETQKHLKVSEEIKTGEVISNRYRVLNIIAKGGMGEVYLCHDEKLARQVAIKRLLPREKEEEKTVERFLREAQAIGSLNHQNIVQVYDVLDIGEIPLIVMEYMEGGSLLKHVKEQGKLKEEDVLKLARAVGLALSYAHRKGVIHRDVKPSNILFTREGIPKLTDFGLARFGRESDLSSTGYGMGTPAYVAPEQRRDAKSADHRADIYSFGKTLYHIATGRLPDTVRESEIPDKLRRVILKAIEERVEDRYFSIDEMLQDIEKGAPTHPPVTEAEVEEGMCPGCGRNNRPDARFCSGCGAGLFDKCPGCGKETRVGIRFCDACGIEVKKEKEIQARLNSAERFKQDKKWSRLIKECEAVLNLEPSRKEAISLKQEAEASISRLKQLLDNAKERLKAEDPDGVRQVLNQAKEISPEDTDIEELSRQIPEIERYREIRDAIKRGQEFLKSNHYEEAEKEFEKAQKLGDEEESTQGIKSARQGKKRITELITSAKESEEKGDWKKAIQLYNEVLSLQPWLEEIKQLVMEYEDRIDRISKCKTLIKDAEDAYQSKEFGKASQLWTRLLELDPSQQGIKEKIAEAQRLEREFKILHTQNRHKQVKIARVSVLCVVVLSVIFWFAWELITNPGHLKKAEGELSAERYENAEIELKKARGLGVKNEDIEKLAMKINNSLYEKFVSEGKDLEDKGKTPDAIEKYQSALALIPDAKEAGQRIETIKEYQRNYTEAENLEKAGKLKEALNSYQKALEYKKTGEAQSKVKSLMVETLKEYQKNYTEAESLEKAGKLKEALNSYQKAIEYKKTDEAQNKVKSLIVKVENYDRWFAKGKEYEKSKKWQEAIDSYKEALKHIPSTNAKERIAYCEEKLIPPHEFTNSIGMKFVLIKAGSFMMGSPSNEERRKDNEAQHKVTLTKDFYLQTTEVTQAQYEEVMGKNPSSWKGRDLPVESVSCKDALYFCNRLSEKEGKEYRLPTEAEWEYACRAGSTWRYSFGDDEGMLREYAWYRSNSSDKTTHPVGQKEPNDWGIYDMHGNVEEWCSDWYGDYPGGSVTDPTGPGNGSYKVARGGSWYSYSSQGYVRSAYRSWGVPVHGENHRGFRCAMTP